MSGILGFVSCHHGMIDVDKLRRGLRLLRHRGPDEAGILLCDASGHTMLRGETSENSEVLNTLGLPENYGSAALACCWLKTKDPGDHGTQPIVSAAAQSFLACDGVIDNGAELRRDLEKLGHNFRYRAATEVLLAALEEWGMDCLSRVAGTFSFVALDLRRRRLFAARDSFGTRPLYFLRHDGVYFSSPIRSPLAKRSASFAEWNHRTAPRSRKDRGTRKSKVGGAAVATGASRLAQPEVVRIRACPGRPRGSSSYASI